MKRVSQLSRGYNGLTGGWARDALWGYCGPFESFEFWKDFGGIITLLKNVIPPKDNNWHIRVMESYRKHESEVWVFSTLSYIWDVSNMALVTYEDKPQGLGIPRANSRDVIFLPWPGWSEVSRGTMLNIVCKRNNNDVLCTYWSNLDDDNTRHGWRSVFSVYSFYLPTEIHINCTLGSLQRVVDMNKTGKRIKKIQIIKMSSRWCHGAEWQALEDRMTLHRFYTRRSPNIDLFKDDSALLWVKPNKAVIEDSVSGL